MDTFIQGRQILDACLIGDKPIESGLRCLLGILCDVDVQMDSNGHMSFEHQPRMKSYKNAHMVIYLLSIILNHECIARSYIMESKGDEPLELNGHRLGGYKRV